MQPPHQPPSSPLPPPPPSAAAVTPTPMPGPTSGRDGGNRVLGVLLVLPAGLALLLSYVLPTGYGLWLSFTDYSILAPAEWVGIDNYQRITEDPRPLGFGFALSFALLPLLVLMIGAPVLAWAAARAGRPARLVTRLALTLPMVCFAPAAMLVAWLASRSGESSGLWDPNLGDPQTAPTHWLLLLWLPLFGLIAGVGVMLYLAALRGHGPTWPALPAVLGTGGLAVIATVAIALQVFTASLLANGGPMDVTMTPLFSAYQHGLGQLNIGYASAQSTLVLIPVMLLGIAAAALVILTRMRLELVDRADVPPADRRPGGVRLAALVVTGVGLVVVLAVTGYGLWPWLSRLGLAGDLLPTSAVTVLVNTWLPPLLPTVIGVGLAAVAGFGIGALRPFGRYSEVLLLPFAPWLFIGVGPLVLAKFVFTQRVGLLNTFLGSMPPVWLVVPALFVFTLLFRGLASQRRAHAAAGADPGVGSVLLGSLPMLVLVGAATWLVQSQSLLWGLVSGVDPDRWTGPVAAYNLYSAWANTSDQMQVGMALPIPAIVLFAVLLGLLQVLYLDRIAVRVGRERQPADSAVT